MYSFDEIKAVDTEIAEAIKEEVDRQNSHIELIASENWVSKAVMAAMGSPLTNKYAEGYPGKRYYGGCDYVDVVERLAIERARELFGCEYVNVQPHSAGGYGDGDEPGPWRTSDPWQPGQHVRGIF